MSRSVYHTRCLWHWPLPRCQVIDYFKSPHDRVGFCSFGPGTLSSRREGNGVSNSTIGTIFNCPLLTKDWFFSGSCVTCRIHTDPLILLNPSIHCPIPSSSPVHYVICAVLVEQDRVRLQAPGFNLGKPPLAPAQSKQSLDWYLPLGFGLVSNSSPLHFIITNHIKITRLCDPRV